MNITFFCVEFPVASETFVQNQIISFIKMGYNVSILSLYPGNNEQLHEDFFKYDLISKTTYVFPYNYASKKSNKLLQKRIIYSLKCLTPDRIQSFNIKKYGHLSSSLYLPSIIGCVTEKYYADFFIAHFGTCGTIASSLRDMGVLNGKLVTVFHGFDISISTVLNRYQKLYADLFVKGEIFLPISNLWKEKMVSIGCDSSKINVIRMGIHLDQFAYKPRYIADKLNIISVCRLIEKKGIEYSIRACALLKEKCIPFHYTVVGYGPLESELTSLIKELGLTDLVSITGFQPQDKVKSMLDKSDVFVLPSITSSNGDMEGIPVALMEAMANGLPVVSTFHSGIPELIENDKHGYLCEEKNFSQIADKFIFILNNPEDVSMVSLNAREKVEKFFNIESEYKKMASILEAHL